MAFHFKFHQANILLFAVALFIPAGRAFPQPSSRQDENRAFEAVFPIGEKLVYEVEWNPPWYFFFLPTMDAGDIVVQLTKEIEYNQRRAIVIVFKAQSSGTLASITGFKIDDNFEFIADAATFCAISASKKQREGKRKRDIDVVYLPETKQLHIREMDVAVTPPVVKKDAYREGIPECVKDLLSALYWVRLKDLAVGMRHKSIIGYDDRVKEVESTVETKEWVNIPSGRCEAWRLNTTALMGGLFKDGGQFRIWLAADRRKLPVQFEIKVSLGKVVGKLKSREN
jgi:hypothetical protein